MKDKIKLEDKVEFEKGRPFIVGVIAVLLHVADRIRTCDHNRDPIDDADNLISNWEDRFM